MTTPQPPAHAWLDPERVLRHIGIDDQDAQAPAVEDARLAAAAWVEGMRPDLWVTTADPDTGLPTGDRTYAAPDSVVQGAVLLTARFVARRSSPAGLASFGEFGPADVPRMDVDVERLLGLGRNASPRLG